MKTRALACALWMGVCGALNAQDWNTGGNFINLPTQYLGCDAFSTQPLRFSTLGNYQHEWRTNNILRMRLMPDNFAGTINGYGGLDLSGFLGIGPFTSAGTGLVTRPFAFLHIDDGGWQDSGYRPWMRQGTLITHQSDQAYFGIKDEGLARNHSVIAWSDNDAWDPGPDLLKFIFTSYLSSGGVSATTDGLEAARFAPDGTGNEVFFGVGDWFNSGGQTPDERVDVLDRTIRLRNFMAGAAPSYENAALNNVLVADPADGRVYWRNIAALPDNCEWNQVSGGPYDDDVWTCAGTNPGCPDQDNNVGIGTAQAAAKLDVLEDSPTNSFDAGVQIGVKAGTGQGFGLLASVKGITSTTYGTYRTGLDAYAENGTVQTYGVDADVNMTVAQSGAGMGQWGIKSLAQVNVPAGTATTRNFGLDAEAIVNTGVVNRNYGAYTWAQGGQIDYGLYAWANDNSGTANYGVYAAAGNGANDYAGFFVGRTWCSLGIWSGSDAMLKTNVEDLVDGLSVILQLQPKTYDFDTSAYGYLGLDGTHQAGLIAQEVESVLPHLVRDVLQPAVVDSIGNVVHPEIAIKGIKYEGLIPYLIAAMQEQNARLDAVENALAACCSGQDLGGVLHMAPNTGGSDPSAKDQRLMVHPNPFTHTTNIALALDRATRVSMTVMGLNGQAVKALDLGEAQPGIFTYTWDTSDMAAGQYVITILLDGKAETAQVVKLSDR